MNRDDENLNVPNLGPAEPVSGARPGATVGAKPAPQTEEPSRGGGIVQSLVIIILIVAVCALGYFGFDVYQAQLKDETTFLKAQQQMEQLQALIKKAEEGAVQSGEKLQGDVSSLESSLRQKDKKLDSEIAKLWVVAHQKNQPKIEQQSKDIAALKKSLGALEKDKTAQQKSIKSLQSTIKAQEKQLKSVAAAKTEIDALQKAVKAEVAKLSKLIARVETETRANTEFMQEQQDEMIKTQRALTDRIIKLEGKSTAGLERRVKLNEQAVKAFDSTRSQLSQDLLFVKQKLNNLQLMIENK
ncbi:hypothetical protein [Neptuniibacter sp.]|uniref:hypothetical protein n=1 Tax=Neptuniibacter sp. TaxID=1962643 RepID=UPI003B5AB1C2